MNADIKARALILEDPDRIAALMRTGLLDSPPEHSFDRLTRLAVNLLDVPVALVSLVDNKRQFFKSAQGLPEPWCTARETPLSHSFCQHVVASGTPLLVDNAVEHPLVHDNLAVRDLGVRAYAGIPLITDTGKVIGSFCAIDVKPRKWTDRDISTLEDLAASVMAEIELRTLAAESAQMARFVEVKSVERLALLDAITEGLYGVDLEGRCTFINRAGAEMIGYSPPELIGRNIHALVHHTRDDGTPCDEKACPIVLDQRGERASELFEPFWRRDGTCFTARISSHPVALRGELTGLLVTFSDVSERLRAERRTAMQHAVSRVLAESSDLETALPLFLQAIGEGLGWEIGAAWEPGRDSRLTCRATWEPRGRPSSPFVEATRRFSFAKGEGLPGMVWATGAAQWLENVSGTPYFLRSEAAEAERLRAAFAFPIRAGGEVLGVIEFFSHAPRAADEDLMQAVATVGNQIGQFVERKRAEAALRLANRAIASSAVGVTISDPYGEDYPIVFTNPAFTQITGYSSDEAIGRNCRFLQGRQTDPAAVQAIRAALREQRECRITLLNYRKDGEPFWNELTISPVLDPTGKLTHFVGIQNDVTDEKRALETLRERDHLLQAIFRSFSAQVAVLDRHGVIAYVSQSWERSAEENPNDVNALGVGGNYIGAFERAASESKHAEQALYGLRAVMSNERANFSLEFPRHLPGEERWFEMHVDAMPPEHGGAVVTHINTTERKRAEDALKEAKLAAEAANCAKSQFLANMSHELRTPLNAVILYSELLQEESEDLEVTQFIPDLQKIGASARHLLSLINNLLDLAKIEAGKMELFYEAFEVANLVREVSETVAPLFAKKNNTLEIVCAPDAGTIHADLTKVRQTLFNLLSNAAKFTEGGHVELRARRERQNDIPWLVFEVSDDGIGMSAEQMRELFQPFVQADASTTRKYGGTGLGLDISRRFCRAMGGDITVASELGKGATFTVRIPVGAEHTSPKGAVRRGEPSSATPRALVIDDDAGVRDLLSRLLRKQGFETVSATDGEEGLRLAREARPTVITLDINMPRMDGWTLMRRLKEDPSLATIPVIMVSVEEEREHGYALGADEYLVKPIEKNRFSAMLKKYHGTRPKPTALVIEDESDTREYLANLLEGDNWSVIKAGDGESALHALSATGAPDLILLDLMMPRMDGFEFLSQLRSSRHWRGIPVVVITAKDLTADDRQRLHGSIQGIVLKRNVDSEQLLAELERVLRSRGVFPDVPAKSA